MSQLQLLWRLQRHDRRISKLKNELENLRKGKDIEELRLHLRQKEYDLTDYRTQREVDNVKIGRNTNKIDQLNFNLKDNEKKLYSGDITDVNQLNHLNKESLELKSKIKDIESETIKLMESVDTLDRLNLRISKEYNDIKNNLDQALKDQDSMIKNILVNIKSEKEKLNILIKKVDKDLLNKYNDLKKHKKKAIVAVKDNRCTGCHMDIPLSLLSQIKNNDTINHCDNCNRILYYIKEK